MNRRLFKLLTLWIVPLLIARAMIPAGYMLTAGPDGLQFMFCPSVQTPAPAQHASAHDVAQVAEHAGHHDAGPHANHASGHGEHDSSGASHDTTPCPFSLVASAALVDVPYVAAARAVVAAEIVEFTSHPAVHAGPVRADRIRGPPQLS